MRHPLSPFISTGLFRKKSEERGGVVDDIDKKPLAIYRFVTLPLENKFPPFEIPQIPRPIENPHDFFLITPRKSSSFLIDSGISACFVNTL